MIATTPACLLPLTDLLAERAHWEARIAAAVLGTGPDLTGGERARALEVGDAYAEVRDAIRFTISSSR